MSIELMNLRKKQSELLSPKQKSAIHELTKLNNNSYKEIAKKVGVDVKTLYTWRKKPEFSSALAESFRELKEEIESKAKTSTYKQSLCSILKYFTNIDKLQHHSNTILLLIVHTLPILIDKQNKFESKDIELVSKRYNLKKNLIEMDQDSIEIRKEIEALASLLK